MKTCPGNFSRAPFAERSQMTQEEMNSCCMSRTMPVRSRVRNRGSHRLSIAFKALRRRSDRSPTSLTGSCIPRLSYFSNRGENARADTLCERFDDK
jgi:hypothetical protein